MDERTEGRTDEQTWATLNALPHSTNGGGIKKKAEFYLVEPKTTKFKLRKSYKKLI